MCLKSDSSKFYIESQPCHFKKWYRPTALAVVADFEGSKLARVPPPLWATHWRRHSRCSWYVTTVLYKHRQFISSNTWNMVLGIFKTITTSGFLTALECTNFVFGLRWGILGYSALTASRAGLRGPTFKGREKGGRERRRWRAEKG